MKGYIGIANADWCNNLQKFGMSVAVFWSKKPSFKALEKGEYFYFLNRQAINGFRFIIGRGKFVEWYKTSPREAWKEYKRTLGYPDEETFLENVRSIYKTDDIELGFIVLKDVEYFNNGVTLSECKIDFSTYIVSGKTINENECTRLNYMLERSINKCK